MDEYNIKDCLLRTMEQIKADYKTDKLCHEGTFESAIYRYLANELESQLRENTKIWCQVKLRKEDESLVSIDIGIVDIDPKGSSLHIKDSISKIHALIELKFTCISKVPFTTLRELRIWDDISKDSFPDRIQSDVTKLTNLKEKCYLMNKKKIQVDNTYFYICCEYRQKGELFTQLMLSKNNKVIYNSSI